jgi:HEAT repeat protein
MEETKDRVVEPVSTKTRKSRVWWWLGGVTFILLLLVGVVAVVLGWHEPKYAEKPLSYWLAELNGTNYVRREIAAAALAKIGEPAISPLHDALRQERAFIYDLRDKVWHIAPASIQKHIPKPWGVDEMQFNACVALAQLGPVAAVTAPDLVQALTNASPAVASRATFALNRMGTNAHPALLAGLKSPDFKLADQCYSILSIARVPVVKPKPQFKYDQYVERIMVDTNLTEAEIKSALQYFSLSQKEAIEVLKPKLENVNSGQRVRAAFLLANLFEQSERITRTLLSEIEKLPTAERAACACGLRMQGPHLQSHAARLEKLAADPEVSVAMHFVLLLETEFALSQPKWALAERIMAGGKEEELMKMEYLLFDCVRTGLEMEKALPYLRQLLSSGPEPLVYNILRMMERNPRWCLPLIPDVERYQQSQTTNTVRATTAGATIKTLKALKALEAAKQPVTPVP